MLALFAYGTLQDGDLLRRVLGREPVEISRRPARLPGHAVERARGADYPVILARDGSVAEGLILSGLSPADMVRLDAYETALYRREPCLAQTDGGLVGAEIYRPTAALVSSGEAWTLAGWRAGRARGGPLDP